jgi:hypothetical protein
MIYFLIAAMGIFFVLLVTAIFQWLWNITMPQAFGLRPIAYWVAFRLLIIAGFLTSGGWIKFNFGG